MSAPILPLRIASWNTGLLGNNPDDHLRYRRTARAIVEDMRAPHILALQEMTDDSGKVDDGTTVGEENAQRLIAAMPEPYRSQYRYCECAPADKADGGAKGMNIRNGYLYRSDRVALTEVAQRVVPRAGRPAIVKPGPEAARMVNFNPARLEEPAFHASRKPLVAQFTDLLTHEDYLFVNLHLPAQTDHHKSADADQLNRPAVAQWRVSQIEKLGEFLDQVGIDLYEANTARPPHVLVLGDFNEHAPPMQGDGGEKPAPLQRLEQSGLWHVTDWLPRGARTAHARTGESYSADHIFVSRALRTRLTALETLPLAEQRYRLSDHNPLLLSVAPQRLEEKDWVFRLDGESSPRSR